MLIWQLFASIASIAATAASTVPIPGTAYATRLGLPMVGGQHIRVVIVDRTRARIQLTGLIKIDGDVSYTRVPSPRYEDDYYTFSLDPSLNGVLRKYGCSLSKARFDTKQDTASVTIDIKPLRLRKRLTLPRELLATG